MEIRFTKLELIPADVEKFKLFQKYYNDFCLMLNAGVFDGKQGQTIINRNHQGTIQEIKQLEISFKRKSPLTKFNRGI